jgi:NAD(P)-dependent dehydrogenase (short-subunit alcohol dehydrogenase family)
MLSEKVVIVTGGGNGVGEGVAEVLGELGATVVVNDLGTSAEGEGESAEPAEETAERIREAGGTATAHFGDVSSVEYTRELVADTVDEYGRVDGAANFAGIVRNRPISEMTKEDWDAVIDVHLGGHFALLHALAARWEDVADEEGGLDTQRSFLGVTSGAALGGRQEANYSAAKAGVLGFVRACSDELGPKNIRVNALSPGAKSRQNTHFYVDRDPEEVERPPDPRKVGPVVGFLMSDDAEDVNGCTIRASGDRIGLQDDPQPIRNAYQNGGWTAEDVAERFHESLGEGVELDKGRSESE